MFANCIMFVVCIVMSIWCFFNQEFSWAAMEIIGALLNLPFAIEWVRNI